MNNSLTLNSFKAEHAGGMLELFYDTVHTVCRKDYSVKQVNAWAPSKEEGLSPWRNRWMESETIVAFMGDKIVGFGNLDNEGQSIDMLYVHKDFQRHRVASTVLTQLETLLLKKGISQAYVESSITARPFFEHQGYSMLKDNLKVKNGVELLNFIMKKELNSKQSG